MSQSATSEGGGRPQAPAAKGMNYMSLLLQVGLFYFMYKTFYGQKKPVQPVVPHDSLSDATPPSLSSATVSPAPDSAPSLFSLMGIPDPSKFVSGVVPELAAYESERAAALAALPSATVLHNLWRHSQTFDLLVFLSTDAAPITDFSALASVHSTGVADETVAEVSGQASQSAPLSLLGGLMQRFISSQTATSRKLSNRTFDGLLSASTPAASEVEPETDSPSTPPQQQAHATALIWAQRGLSYGWDEGTAREQMFNVSLPTSVLENRTALYAHAYFLLNGVAAHRKLPPPPSWRVIRLVSPIVVYLNKKPVKATYSLLGDGQAGNGSSPAPAMAWGIGAASGKPTPSTSHEPAAADSGADQHEAAPPHSDAASSSSIRVLPYWRPALNLELIHDFTAYGVKGLPPHVGATIAVQPGPAGSPGYTPLAWVNTFWVLGHHLIPVNTTTLSLPLTISYTTASMWKWAMQSQMTSQWAMQESMGGSREGDTDMIKSIMLETNPILLGVTVLVSVLHTVFEFLAFKNDVSFWRSAKSMEGVSVRSLALNAFSQLIILLYLFDNETSYMVLISATIGVAIEFWKLRKAVSVNLKWEGGWPVLSFQDVEVGYTASRTKEYDERAMSHLLFAVYPLLVGYAAYSLLYERHRGWYSWIITSLTGFIYTFGFIQMSPQLYINYRLKSTVALPFRPLMYKALNTVVDDLFSFVVKMPMMHRLACFRDDVIFVILMYQRWIYPVDKTRRNEFGATGEDYEAVQLRQAGGGHRAARRGKLEKRPLQNGAANGVAAAGVVPGAGPTDTTCN